MQILGCGLRDHPCFNKNSHGKFGRIHLPVAPRCNIQCAFCDRRFDCVNESRPGVTSELISPEEAILRVAKAIAKEPLIRVAGIAGPGDPLANPETFETLRGLRRSFPKLILCLSTNGLLLEDSLEELLEAGVDTLTATINAVTAETAAKICTSVRIGGNELPRLEGAKLLIEKQQRALAACQKAHIPVKINTILIPGVNNHEIKAVAQTAAHFDCAVMNITPLIPCGDMSGNPAPTPEAVAATRREAGAYISQMLHCRQCRADACGIV